MAVIKVETWIHRYPAAELWETDSWFVKIRFNDKWVARDGWFKDEDSAIARAKSIADELDGTYEGQDTWNVPGSVG